MIRLIRNSAEPLHQQLYRQIRDELVSGSFSNNSYPTDLNDLKGDYSAFLALAKDINDKGEITGRAVDPSTGALIAYLAVPVDNN